MFCQKCGKEIADDAVVCTGCGRQVTNSFIGTAQNGAAVPNYMVQAILATLFCCLPFGIVSIIFAAKVNSLAAAGDMTGATEASRKAKMWCWIAFGSGLAFTVIYVLVMVIAQVA